VALHLQQNATSLTTELKVMEIQVDNYTEKTRSPILVRSLKPNKMENHPLVHLCMRQLLGIGVAGSFYEYISVLVLGLHIDIDAPTIVIYLADFASDIANLMDEDQIQSKNYPEMWQRMHVLNSINPVTTRHSVDVFGLRRRCTSDKVFVENLEIHPVGLEVTFRPDDFPRPMSDYPAGYPTLQNLHNKVLALNDITLRLNSFITSNLSASPGALVDRIVAKCKADLQAQAMNILGSYLGNLQLIGKPVGLVKNIGGGLHEFFYEPAAGLMESPAKFASGLAKGTTGLLQGVVGGALTSATTIVESATSGVGVAAAWVAGDTGVEERRRQREGTSGLWSGITGGATSIVGGVASGVTGLVTKPLEGGRKGGAIGFLQGMGHGIVGVAAAPVIGVTEGLSSVAHGMGSVVSTNTAAVRQRRPPRVFEASLDNKGPTFLVAFDRVAADAQASAAAALQRTNKRPDDVLKVRGANSNSNSNPYPNPNPNPKPKP